MGLGSGSGSRGGGGLGSGTRTAKSQPSLFGKILHGAGAVVKPAANLLGDIKDAAVGLPMGVVQTVQHPIRTAEQAVDMTWHTWSPLFKGDFQKFGKQLYDHPLAPILDVASVFSLGLGASVKAANVAVASGHAAEVGKVATLSKLSHGGSRTLTAAAGDTTLDTVKYLSRRPSRRLLQEGILKIDDAGHLPQWYVRRRYNRGHLVDMAHKSVAKTESHADALKKAKAVEEGTHPVQLGADPGLVIGHDVDGVYGAIASQVHATINGARAMEDVTEVGKKARKSIVVGLYTNFIRHNKAYDEARALQLAGSRNSHNGYIMDPAYIDRAYASQLRRLERRHSRATQTRSTFLNDATPRRERWTASKAAATAKAQGLARTEKQIADINSELAELASRGHVIEGGARDGSNRMISNPSKKQLANYETKRIYDLHTQLAELQKKRETARQSGVKAERIQSRLDKMDAKEVQLTQDVMDKHTAMNEHADRSVEDHFAQAGDSYEAVKNFVNKFGSRAMTHNLKYALRDTEGRVYVAAKHDAYSLGLEAEGSLHFLHEALHKPTQVWKYVTVGYTPRTITNNGVGNWFMYGVAAAGPRGMQAFTDALRYQFGKDMIGDNVFGRNHWIDRYFKDELGDQFGVGNEIVKHGFDELADMRFSKQWWKRHARQGLYPIVQKTSERPVRLASLYHTMRGFDEVKLEIKAARAKGMRGQKAVDYGIERALKLNPNIRGEAALQSRRVAGDYVTMSGSEKWARDIIPFYLWNRHILKHTGNMFLETPGRVAIGAKLGELGVSETEALVGQLPDFLKGAIPLMALGFGDRPGRMNLLSTASLNPYATVGELADTVAAWSLGGKARRGAALSQANPFLVGAAESIFQTSALTGVPSPRKGGVFEDVLGRTLVQFPYVKAGKIFSDGNRFKTPKGNDLLFGQTKETAVLSLLGVPVKDTNRARAKQLQEQLDGVEKKKGGLGQ